MWWAVTGAKANERTVLVEILTGTPGLYRPGYGWQVVIGDKNYNGRALDTELAEAGITMARPPRGRGASARRGPVPETFAAGD